MPRPPRINLPELVYHLIARGDNGELVFAEERDYQTYLTLLERYRRTFALELYAFCLMPNHVHLLLKTRTANLSQFMQRLQTRYSQFFNRRYSRVGHVFQGRFKALLVNKEAYLLELIRYIHMNPVRAGLVRTPQDYPWSSYHWYLGTRPGGEVQTSEILERFGRKDRIQRFKVFTQDRQMGHQLNQEGLSILENPAVDMGNALENPQPEDLHEKELMTPSDHGSLTPTFIIERAAQWLRLLPDELCKKSQDRNLGLPRGMVMYLLREYTDVKLKAIAELFGIAYTESVNRILNNIKKRISNDPQVADRFRKLEEHIMI